MYPDAKTSEDRFRRSITKAADHWYRIPGLNPCPSGGIATVRIPEAFEASRTLRKIGKGESGSATMTSIRLSEFRL